MSSIRIFNGGRATAKETRERAKAVEPVWHATIPQAYIFGGNPYDGPYTVTPDADGEVLITHEKYMRDDVTVHPIPYVETTNESGGYTVSIAS